MHGQLTVNPTRTFVAAGETLTIQVSVLEHNVSRKSARRIDRKLEPWKRRWMALDCSYVAIHAGAEVLDKSRGIAYPLKTSI